MAKFTPVITRSGVTDPFQYMAGGEAYNGHRAGNDLYYAPEASALMDMTGGQSHVSKDNFVFNYGSDALEKIFDLTPFPMDTITRYIRIISYTSDEQGRVTITNERYVEAEGNSESETEARDSVGTGSFISIVNAKLTTPEAIGANLASIGAMMAGYKGPGLFPAMVGVVAVDVLSGRSINSAAMAKMTFDFTLNTFAEQATRMAIQSFGITNPALAMGLGAVISMAFTEAVEVAMGLDSQYGYGGDIVGHTKGGQAVYAELEGTFIERMQIGFKDTIMEMVTLGSYYSALEHAEYKAEQEKRELSWKEEYAVNRIDNILEDSTDWDGDFHGVGEDFGGGFGTDGTDGFGGYGEDSEVG